MATSCLMESVVGWTWLVRSWSGLDHGADVMTRQNDTWNLLEEESDNVIACVSQQSLVSRPPNYPTKRQVPIPKNLACSTLKVSQKGICAGCSSRSVLLVLVAMTYAAHASSFPYAYRNA